MSTVKKIKILTTTLFGIQFCHKKMNAIGSLGVTQDAQRADLVPVVLNICKLLYVVSSTSPWNNRFSSWVIGNFGCMYKNIVKPGCFCVAVNK
jgi:hypothetical protein